MTVLSFKGPAPVMEFCHRDSRMFITNRRFEPRVLLDQIHPFPFREPNRRRGLSAASEEILSATLVLTAWRIIAEYMSFLVHRHVRVARKIPGVTGARRCSAKNSPEIQVGEAATKT